MSHILVDYGTEFMGGSERIYESYFSSKNIKTYHRIINFSKLESSHLLGAFLTNPIPKLRKFLNFVIRFNVFARKILFGKLCPPPKIGYPILSPFLPNSHLTYQSISQKGINITGNKISRKGQHSLVMAIKW